MSYSRVQASGLEPYNLVRTLAVALVLFLCSAGFFALLGRLGPPAWFRLEYCGLVLAGLSVVVGYHDQGMFRVWVFVFALAAGFGIHLGGIGITGEMPGVPFRVVWAIIVGIITAVTLGTVFGLVGVDAHLLTSDNNSQR